MRNSACCPERLRIGGALAKLPDGGTGRPGRAGFLLTYRDSPVIISSAKLGLVGELLKLSKILVLLFAVLIVALFFLQGLQPGWTEGEDSQCVQCHTTPRKLIATVREMERERGPGPKVSTETEGEG